MNITPENSLERATSFYEQGEYESALKIYQNLLSLEKSNEQIAILQNYIGLCFYGLEKFDKAEKYFKLFLNTLMLETNPDWNDIAVANNNIGDALSAKLEKDEAITFYEASLKTYLDFSEEIVEEMIKQNTNIGHCYYYQELYTDAEPYYISAKQYATELYDKKNDRANLCRFDLAESLYYQGKTKEAFKEFSEVYYFFEDENQYVNKIDVLNHLTNLCFDLPAETLHENYYLQLYTECERVYGNKSIDAAISTKMLGRFYLRMKNYSAACQYFEKAFSLFSQLRGEIHDDTINVSTFLTEAYYKNKQYLKAKEIAAYVLSVKRRKSKNSDIALLYPVANLAFASFRCKDFSNAEKLFEEAILISAKTPEKYDNDIRQYKIYLADSINKSGQYSKAAQKLKQFIESENKLSSTSDDYLYSLYTRLAQNLAGIKNKAPEAEFFYLQSIDYIKKLYPNDYNLLSDEKLKLAALYRDEFNQRNKSFEILNEIKNDLENYGAQKSLVYFKTQVDIGKISNASKNFEKTLEILQPLIDRTKEENLIPDDWKISYFKVIGEAELSLNNKKNALNYFSECYRLAEQYYGPEDGHTQWYRKIIDDNSSENISSEKVNDTLLPEGLLKYNKFIINEFRADLKKRNVRVFISSTFRDMMAERDYLMKNVFPEIKQTCKEYGIDFTEIDLRWGVTNEEAEQGKVIQICLNEIDKSRPYFIGILGERYGWVPDETVRYKIEKTLENFQWLHQDFEDKLSITEMEIQYGVLRNQKMKGNAFFYFRDKILTPDHADFFEIENSNEHQKLQQLKRKLKGQNEFPTYDFDSVKKLGELIAHDLQQAIIRDSKLDQKLTPILKYRVAQINHIKHHSEFYIPLQKSLKKLDGVIDGNSNKIVIYAPQGKGKTALLSFWIRKIFEQKNTIPLIFHLTGASSEINNVNALFWHISKELSALFNFENDYDEDNENRAAEFLRILKKISSASRVIIVIDGIESIKSNSFFSKLYWLPVEIPKNVKLIVSTNCNDFLDNLKKRGFEKITIENLNQNQKTNFIKKYLQQFGKKLPGNLVEQLAGSTMAKTPLTLKIVLNELRLMGIHENLELELNKYLEARNTIELYVRVLDRMEHDFDEDFPDLVSNVLSLLACSKLGLSEHEIMDLTKSARLFLSPILLSLEDYLNKVGSFINIGNIMFLEAVGQKYLSDKKIEREIKTRIVNYLFNINDAKRKANELAPLLFELKDKKRLAALFAEIPVFDFIIKNGIEEAFIYYNFIKDEFDVLNIFKKNLEKEKHSKNLKIDLINQLKSISSFFLFNLCFSEAEFFTEKAYQMAKEVYGENHVNTAKPLTSLARVYSDQKNEAKAKSLFQKAITIFENTTFEFGLDLANAYVSLAHIYISENDLDEAKILAEKSRKFLESKYGKSNIALSETFQLFGEIELKNKNFAVAESWVKQAINLLETHFGYENLHYQMAAIALLDVYDENDDLSKGLNLLLEMEDVFSQKLGEDHVLTGGTKFRIASKYFQKHEFDIAEKKAVELIRLAEKYGQLEEEYVLYTEDLLDKIQEIKTNKARIEKEKEEIGIFLKEKQKQVIQQIEGKNNVFKTEMEKFEENVDSDNFSDAVQNLKNALSINQDVLDSKIKTINNGTINLSLGKIYFSTDEFEDCINYCTEAFAIFKENEYFHEMTECLSFTADSYYLLEDYKNAIYHHTQVLSIYEKIPDRYEKRLSQVFHDLALDYYWNDETDKAISFAKKALEIRIQLFGIDSEETDDARFLLGRSYYFEDLLDEAKECFVISLEFRKQFFGKSSEEYNDAVEWLNEINN